MCCCPEGLMGEMKWVVILSIRLFCVMLFLENKLEFEISLA